MFIAVVESQRGAYVVRLLPTGYSFSVDARPRPPVGARLAVDLPGLAAPTRDAIEAWRVRHAPPPLGLPRACYREAKLGDLMDAVNAELHRDFARAAGADERAAFATARGGALLAELRAAAERSRDAALAGEFADRLAPRVARFGDIAGVAYVEDALAALAPLHPVERLLGLEYALAQWIRATTEPAADELAALAKQLPADTASAGASRAWFHWWWQLAHRAPRGDLRAAALAAVDCARAECARVAIAHDALAEAARALDRMQIAPASRMWSGPPDGSFAPVRDDDDAHACAYLAVTHAAHAVAAALRTDHDAGEANARAMQLVAERALARLCNSKAQVGNYSKR